MHHPLNACISFWSSIGYCHLTKLRAFSCYYVIRTTDAADLFHVCSNLNPTSTILCWIIYRYIEKVTMAEQETYEYLKTQRYGWEMLIVGGHVQSLITRNMILDKLPAIGPEGAFWRTT
jgi:hypothetical protein